MWFGLYLHDRKLISSDDFVAALRTRFRSHKRLGSLAVESGMLSTRQVHELLLKQINDPRPIGELAVAAGLLTRQDVAELLLMQSEQAVSVGDALIEMGLFTPEEIAQHLTTGRRTMAERAQDEVGMETTA